jgi:hypothetical protein
MSQSAFDRAGAACVAMAIVIIAHVTLRRFGFDKLYALATRVPAGTASTAPASERSARIDLVVRSVDRACRVICRRSFCVQRTTALATLLRWQGIDAVMVFGVRRPPFQAHAWTEVDGVPIGEPTGTVIRYTAIRRSGPAAGWRARARRDMGLSKI